MISNKELIKRAVMNAKSRKIGIHPRWVGVSEIFKCGSSVAYNLCNVCEVGPDDMIQGEYDTCPECYDNIMDENGCCPNCS